MQAEGEIERGAHVLMRVCEWNTLRFLGLYWPIHTRKSKVLVSSTGVLFNGHTGEGPGGEDNGLSGIYTKSLHLPETLQAVIRGMHLREGLVSMEDHCRP